jgi:hypothetical protein
MVVDFRTLRKNRAIRLKERNSGPLPKICSKCKKRKVSKFHHFLCEICWKKKEKEYLENKGIQT